MNSKKFLALVMYLAISISIISSYGCKGETRMVMLYLNIHTIGATCGTYCTYTPKIEHFNRWNSNNTEVIIPPIACTGGTWNYETYPAQGTVQYQCIARCCTVNRVACLVESDVIPKPRAKSDQVSVSVGIPCIAYAIGC
jgi:hypothetical protein